MSFEFCRIKFQTKPVPENQEAPNILSSLASRMSTADSEQDDRWEQEEDGRGLLGNAEKSLHHSRCSECQSRPWPLRTGKSMATSFLLCIGMSLLLAIMVVVWASRKGSGFGDMHGCE